MGVFLSPTDPNTYMTDWAREGADYVVVEQGTQRLILHFIPQLSIDWSPVSLLRVQSLSELGWGPKVVSVSGASEKTRVFQFIRASELLLVNLELGIDAKRIFYVGGGPALHWLKFEEHQGTTVGGRGQLGIAFKHGSLRVDGQVAYDYAVATAVLAPFELDYSSVHLDAIVHFELVR